MKLRHILLTALSCVVLVGAAGNAPSGGTGGNGGTDTGTNGGTDGNMKRGMNDSMMVRGTIESMDTTDSMFVVRSDTTTDTIYYNEQTTMKIMKNKFVKGANVFVKYNMMNGKKMATQVFAGKKTKQGSSKKNDTSTTPGGPSGGSKEY